MAGFENDVVYAKNADFTQTDNQAPTEANGLATDGQLWVGTTVVNAGGTHINVGALTSPDASIVIGYSSPNITLQTGSATTLTVDTDNGSATPVANTLNLLGVVNLAGNDPLSTSGSGNTVNINTQISQAVAAADPTTIGLSSFNSGQFDVDADGFVSLLGGGQAIDSIAVQTGTSPIVPTAAGLVTINGASVAAGTNPVRTDGTGANTLAVEVQTAQAIGATNAANIGLAAFDSAAFDVDANGFVQLNGGGIATTSFDVQANTPPGTDPVVPTVAGVLTVNGAVVANHSVVLETRSRAANAYNVEVQYAAAAASTTAASSGVAHFNSAQFTVDATGFVSTSGTGVMNTITGDTGGALSPTAGNFNILGGPGVTTSGSGSTLTINSVVFTNTTATTLAVDNGYNATAAGTYNMPATAAQGEMIIVFCDTTGAVVLDCPALNFIRIGTAITSSGGTVTSTLQGDSLTLRYRLSTLTWEAVSVVGNWILA